MSTVIHQTHRSVLLKFSWHPKILKLIDSIRWRLICLSADVIIIQAGVMGVFSRIVDDLTINQE